MWDATFEYGGYPQGLPRDPTTLTGAGPMMTNDGEDLIGHYTHLNAGSSLSLATSEKWEPANTMNVNPAG